ncbi:MAG: hypothetical protein KGY48_08365 [Wenzhouxiangellaceae bacterium]|nr:hypothetical protein [Wenzhouxiangellaceae bacterium]MBS3747762.1 hypothetical protein [Wenzhouxiangellaceae bacterium]MBS3822828.1 hypothetical protein [Wenzhouxiangellaceae bacterium]
MSEDELLFDDAADQVVDLGNTIADANPEADIWAIADGLIAGAVHFWLYAHQPDEHADAEEMDGLMTANQRIEALMSLFRDSAIDSEYLHSPHDLDAGRA